MGSLFYFFILLLSGKISQEISYIRGHGIYQFCRLFTFNVHLRFL